MSLNRPYNLRDRAVRESLDMLVAPERPAPEAHAPQCAVVCIHGILSNHKTCFDDFFQIVTEDDRFKTWDVCWYDYNYHDSMQTNGTQLARTLTRYFQEGDKVVLVCHSMGGLVARFALLGTFMPFVEKIFLLGTPNLGVFRSHQIGLLALLGLTTTRWVHGWFSRKQGILDLTRVPELVNEFVNSGGGSYHRAETVEYITLPGMYFDTDRNPLRMRLERWKVVFGSLDLQLAAVSGLPGMKSRLQPPHDGIVEAASNCMIPEGQEYPSTEKTAPIRDAEHWPRSYYAHVVHVPACKASTHVQILHDERIIRLLGDLILCDNVPDWDKARPGSHEIIVRLR
jgi:pimeloyl-ACP methyl ester carboxylesterase